MDRKWREVVVDLAELTAVELMSHYAAGTASPSEAVSACMSRVEQYDGQINAILTPMFEQATEAADRSTARWAAGTARPLEGVPYGLKDIIATEGVLTTGGSALYKSWIPSSDAVVADRLVSAGGIPMAKLQTFEFACGGAANKTFGPVHNPWDLRRTTGGSSSGSAAAVAAGMLPVAIGTDTGGSIRIPSAYCGLSGLKPTYGRVPRSGIMGLSWTCDHAGPMTRSVADAAAVLGVIAGHHPSDPYASRRGVPAYLEVLDRDVTGLRVGRPTDYLLERTHPAVADAFQSAVAVLERAGAVVVDVKLPLAELAEAAAWLAIYAEMLAYHSDHLPGIDDRDEMGAGLLALGPFVSAADYLRAMRFRVLFQQSIEAVFDDVDVLVTTGTPTIAPLLDDMLADIGTERVDWLKVASRTSIPFNFTGQPALCVPSGFVEGMPVSLQIVGRPHDDSTVLALGAAFQRETQHHLTRPDLDVHGKKATYVR
jgi:aspartyl-tRNA(Asn)/glutamyl-tRNA(Gln) amidotransferase subunit A